jgi:pimeloyl-ACP methyl ester carboxylesterase
MAASATIPNSDIVLRRSGDGDNAVVFVHGFLDDQYAWNSVLADLSAPGFETIQFDQAGFGDRAEPSGPINFDLFAGNLAAVVDAVDEPFVLVGHSMAAPIVELVASAHPARALGLVLVAQSLWPEPTSPTSSWRCLDQWRRTWQPVARPHRRHPPPNSPESRRQLRSASQSSCGPPPTCGTPAIPLASGSANSPVLY